MAFPQVATSNSGNTAAGSASCVVTLPSGVSSGDLLVVWVAFDQNGSATWPAGWTEHFDRNFSTAGFPGSGTGTLGTRVADGTEGSTITVTKSNTQEDAWGVYRITGASGNVEFAFAEGNDANVDPPNLIPSWGAKDTLWIAAACEDNADLTGTAPTNYANNVLHQFNTDAEIVMGTRELNATSENPGTFAAAADEWFALTIAVEPDAGGAFTLTASGGSYSVSGTAASLEFGRLVSAAGSSYSVTGAAASLEFGRLVGAGAGVYSISGAAASLLAAFKLAADSGSYTINGAAATLNKGQSLIADGGSYSVSGGAVGFLFSHLVAANSGSYLISGAVASLEFGHLLGAGSESYLISGNDASLERGFPLIAAGGSYAINGAAANFMHSYVVAANSASYTINGQSANLIYTPTGGGSIGTILPIWRRRRR